MNAPDLGNVVWKKSSRSSGNGQCVMTARLDGAVAVCDSKDFTGPALVFGPAVWAAFTSAVKGDTIAR
ncbi:DUF397 domain-containing protein [Plantactinospora sonchi]|uniref:DUF397 domain-containing protein n=1 Tax=Plantactinospora sonchi TaxID=1544735 RepID=A0ABU7RMR8_9ACTN